MLDSDSQWGLTYLPSQVRNLFRGMPGIWRYRHELIFCWLIVMQIVLYGPRTLTRLSQSAPRFITEWRFQRLLSAGYWSIRLFLMWFAQEAIKCLPPPEDKVVYVIGDSSKKDKRGQKNPAIQKGRMSEKKTWFFGIRFVILMVAWDNYRIPVDFFIILPKSHPDYKKENDLFQIMLSTFQPPAWAELIIVSGDAAYASKDNMKFVKQLDKSDPIRKWAFLFAIPRTWKMENDKNLKNLVKHTPHSCYRRTWIPRLPGNNGRKTFWIFEKRTRLKHIGDVILVASKKRPNSSPKKTKLLVTNLLELTGRQVILIYQRRWSIEILFKELKSGLGMGEHQVAKDIPRIEKSLGIAIIAYLVLIRARKDDIKPGQPWSIFQLKNNFRFQMLRQQFQHSLEINMNNIKKAA